MRDVFSQTLITKTVVAIFLLAQASTASSSCIIEEASVSPSETDNFYEARARLWVPEKSDAICGLLVSIGGTDSDGRGFVMQERWQRLAKREKLALLGCHFRGEGEPYEQAAGGSGKALQQIIDQMAKTANLPQLSQAPLFFLGYSSGAMFAYNFACWRPERTAAFVSIKSGPISVEQDCRVAAIPALFIIGEHDTSGRIQAVSKVFDWQQQFSGRWSLAVEPDKGHEWTPAVTEFVDSYLRDVVPYALSKNGNSSGCTRNLRSPSATSVTRDNASDRVWFPNCDSALVWEKFTMPASVEKLAVKPMENATPALAVSPRMLDFGKVDIVHDYPTNFRTSTVIAIDCKEPLDCSFSSRDPRLAVVTERYRNNSFGLAMTLKTAGLSTGLYRSTVDIACKSKATGVQELSVDVTAQIISSLSISPTSIYLGFLSRGQVVEKLVTISSADEKVLNILDIKSSHPQFTSILHKSSKKGTASFICRFNANNVIGNQSGHLNVFINNAESGSIRIPFIAFVSKTKQEPTSSGADQK